MKTLSVDVQGIVAQSFDLRTSPAAVEAYETGLPLDPKPPKVAHVKGTKKAIACTSGDKS